jgi:hypothetical protein
MNTDKSKIKECANLLHTHIWTIQQRKDKEGILYYVFSARHRTPEQHIEFMNALRELQITTPIYIRWTIYDRESNKNKEIGKERV